MSNLTIEQAGLQGYEMGQRQFYRPSTHPFALTTWHGDDAEIRARAYEIATGWLPIPPHITSAEEEAMYNAFADQFVTGWHAAETEKAERIGSDRFEFRLPLELKRWLIANGGSELVRRLLEDERAKQTDKAI